MELLLAAALVDQQSQSSGDHGPDFLPGIDKYLSCYRSWIPKTKRNESDCGGCTW